MYLELNSQTYSSHVCVQDNSLHFQASSRGTLVTEGPCPLLPPSAHSDHKWMSGMIHQLAQVQSWRTPHHAPAQHIVIFIITVVWLMFLHCYATTNSSATYINYPFYKPSIFLISQKLIKPKLISKHFPCYKLKMVSGIKDFSPHIQSSL
jgi:hypothetical protein